MLPLRSINRTVLQIFSGLCVASTSRTAMGDVVMVLWISGNREDSAGSVRQLS